MEATILDIKQTFKALTYVVSRTHSPWDASYPKRDLDSMSRLHQIYGLSVSQQGKTLMKS